MLIPNQQILITWNSRNKEHYINKGYEFTKMREPLWVKAEDLKQGSHSLVKVACDYCGVIRDMPYKNYLKHHDKELGDCCFDCCQVKREATTMKNYNVKNPSYSKEIQQKTKETNLKKYGCKTYSGTKQCKEKVANTCKERYGSSCYLNSEQGKKQIKNTLKEKYGVEVENVSQIPEIKEKVKATCQKKYGSNCFLSSKEGKELVKQIYLERYGTESPLQLPKIQEKRIKTNLKKYGVKYPMQCPEIKRKAVMSFYQNGTCRTSKQQYKMYEILKEIYPNCELNYPERRYSLDCYININGVKIDIEYDGIYWHLDKEKDLQRDNYLKSLGYKIFRIVAQKETPTAQQLQDGINYLLQGNDFLKIKLDI